MDLNKPIKFNFSFNSGSLEGAKLPLIIATLGLIVALAISYFIYSSFDNQSLFQDSQTQLDKLKQEKISLEKNLISLQKNNAAYFKNVQSAPKTKSELVSFLSKSIGSHSLKLAKLDSNEAATGDKANSIEVEVDGSFANINLFTKDVVALLSSSEVQYLKISKPKEGNLLHLGMGIKFSTPPTINIKTESRSTVATEPQSMNRGYGFIKVGFVPVNPEVGSPTVPTPSAETPVNKDPFAAPEISKKQDLQNGGVTNVESKDFEKKVSGYFLTGILFSNQGKLCVITLPSGESKVFTEGDNISSKVKVEKIFNDHIITNSKKYSNVKVGNEVLQ